jgi:hypothetical protein
MFDSAVVIQQIVTQSNAYILLYSVGVIREPNILSQIDMHAVRKRCQKQTPTERQKKRLRLDGALVPFTGAVLGTETITVQLPALFSIQTDNLFRWKKWNQRPVSGVVVVESQSILGGESCRISGADGWKNVQDEPHSCLAGSTDSCDDSSSIRYESEESCVSLPMLEIQERTSHGTDGCQRRQEVEYKAIHHGQQEPRSSERSICFEVAILVVMMGLVCLSSFGIDWGASLNTVVDQMLHRAIESDSICVSGGGFSGFWYIIGRLQSLPEPMNKNYYCFSAGCLGLVASLRGITMDEVHGAAIDAQSRWKAGEISRQEVLTSFVDSLIYYNASNETGIDEQNFPFLNRLNVLTTVRDGRFGLKTSTRTPTNVDSLRTLLIQTAWIPFVVGNGLFYQDHMDGAFHLIGHPRCEHSIGLPGNFDVLANILNVNLSAYKVKKFWKMGLERGL